MNKKIDKTIKSVRKTKKDLLNEAKKNKGYVKATSYASFMGIPTFAFENGTIKQIG